MLDAHAADRSRFTFTGLLDRDEFAATVEAVDVFLYPLQFGSANWGLFELLGRGLIVLASDRCFVPEAITDDENGFLIDYDDIDTWVTKTVEILDDPPQFRPIAEAARQTARRYAIDQTGQEFLDLVGRVMSNRRSAWTGR